MEHSSYSKRRYIFLSLLLLSLGLVAAMLPDKNNKPELGPEQVLAAIKDNNRFVNTDEVAVALMNKDPQWVLIDVRSAAEFNVWSLPGAINIPLETLLDPMWEDVFYDDFRKYVLYSTGSIYANQAWMILKRLNYKNIYVMQGGLNEWFATIIMPTPPAELDDVAAMNRYEFRKAAALYFTGATTAPGNAAQGDAGNATSQPAARTKKKESAVGGC